MIRLVILALTCGIVAASAPPAPTNPVKKGFEDGVKKIEGSFSPTEAKPGQTVTFKVTVELKEGYHTYPTSQANKCAEFFVNEFKFPKTDGLIFVGTTQDPKDARTKNDEDLKCEYQYCTGTAIYSRKVVVSPKAGPGAMTVKLPSYTLNICDEKNCFPPPKKMPEVSATLKILDGPAVPVDKEFAEEVKKALGEK